jgi:hypothetical protein
MSRWSKYYDDDLFDNNDNGYGYGYGYGYDYYGYGSSSRGAIHRGSRNKYVQPSFSHTKWSSYSWSSSVADDDSNLFIKDPVSYETPSMSEIRKKSFANLEKSLITIKELARVCYLKMIDDKDFIAEKFKDFDALDDDAKKDYEQKNKLYAQIYETFIPGVTPLEQALHIFNNISNGTNEGVSDSTKEKVNFDSTLHFDRKLYCDPTINEQLEYNSLSKERKADILNKLSLIGDFGSQFKVEKTTDEKIVANSVDKAKKIMRDYSQFVQIELYQKLMPTFKTKLLTKNLIVDVPIDRTEQKQKIIILLDFSGSMEDENKQIWVNALLIDRFRYVIKGEAEVFFSYFVRSNSGLKFFHIKDETDVKKFWGWFSNSPNGGMTDIGGIIDYVAENIENGKLHNLNIDLSTEKPEILIINDGQDSIGREQFPYKVNAVSLYMDNRELRKLCVGCGGKYITVKHDEKLKLYSDQGEQELE